MAPNSKESYQTIETQPIVVDTTDRPDGPRARESFGRPMVLLIALLIGTASVAYTSHTHTMMKNNSKMHTNIIKDLTKRIMELESSHAFHKSQTVASLPASIAEQKFPILGAGAKGEFEQCYSNGECASGDCAPKPYAFCKGGSKQPIGGECTKDGACESGVCYAGKCVAPGKKKNGDECSGAINSEAECYSGSCMFFKCTDKTSGFCELTANCKSPLLCSTLSYGLYQCMNKNDMDFFGAKEVVTPTELRRGGT